MMSPASNERVGPVGNHADDFGIQPEQVPDENHAADARTHPDRHVNRIEARDGLEQLVCIGRDAAHQVFVK